MNTESKQITLENSSRPSPAPAQLPAKATPEEHVFFALQQEIARGTDPDRLQKMLDMSLQVMDRQNEQAFNKAMRLAKKSMPAVVARGYNDQTKSPYAKLEDIQQTIEPVYNKRGFSCSFGEDDCPKEDHIRVVCDVSHDDGHTRRYHLDIPTDMTGPGGKANKTRTHGTMSAVTYGQARLLRLIWNVRVIGEPEDDDGNGAGTPPIEFITENQVNELHAKITDNDLNMDLILNWLANTPARAGRLEDIPAEFYDRVMKKINDTIRMKKP